MHFKRQRQLLHNDEKAATKNENQIDNCKPGKLLAQGFKLDRCVDRVGIQARATCSHGDRYGAVLTETLTLGYSENWMVTTRRREAMLSLECTF